jgi:hypothetical protein
VVSGGAVVVQWRQLRMKLNERAWK